MPFLLSRGKILGFWGSSSFLGSILGYGIPSFFISSESVEDSPWQTRRKTLMKWSHQVYSDDDFDAEDLGEGECEEEYLDDTGKQKFKSKIT